LTWFKMPLIWVLQHLTLRRNKMTTLTTNTEARFQVILIGHGGVVCKEFLDTPYHNSDWPTYKGDTVSVYDRQDQEWLPDYVIQVNSY